MIECLSHRTKTREKEELTLKNQKLNQKIDSYEQKLNLEKSKYEVVIEDNKLLKETLKNLSDEKQKLLDLINNNLNNKVHNKRLMSKLDSLNHNIKLIESNTITELTQKEDEMLTERSKEIKKLNDKISKLKNENMRLKMEVRFHSSVIKLADKMSPKKILHLCIQAMKKAYAMYVMTQMHIRYTNNLRSK